MDPNETDTRFVDMIYANYQNAEMTGYARLIRHRAYADAIRQSGQSGDPQRRSKMTKIVHNFIQLWECNIPVADEMVWDAYATASESVTYDR